MVRRLPYWKELDRTERELIALSPDDEAEIKKFIQHVRYAESCTIPAEKPMDMMKISDYIKMGKSMADMPKVMKEYGKIDLNGLAERFHSPLLKKLMTDYLPANYTAYSFLVSYATMTSGNGNIPIGGSLAMTNRIIEKYKSMGGELYIDTPVKRILVENGTAKGIELESGKKVMADEVISAVDLSFLFGELIDKSYMPKELKKGYTSSNEYPTTSGFQMAFKIDDTFSGEDTICFGCDPIIIGNRHFDRIFVRNYSYDKTFAPEGKAVLQTNIPQTDEDFHYWKSLSKDDYRTKKQELIKEVTNRIVRKFPELEGNLELLDCWTPLTYERYCNAYHGAYMAFATTLNAKQLKIKGELKSLKNFYMAGQWIMSPGGLPIAAISGKFAIQRILKKEKKSIDI